MQVGEENFYLEYEIKIQVYNDVGKGPNSTEAVVYSAEGSEWTLIVNMLFITLCLRVGKWVHGPIFVYSAYSSSTGTILWCTQLHCYACHVATGFRYAGNYERKSVGISGKGHFIFYHLVNSFHFFFAFSFFWLQYYKEVAARKTRKATIHLVSQSVNWFCISGCKTNFRYLNFSFITWALEILFTCFVSVRWTTG